MAVLYNVIAVISSWAIPLTLLMIPVYAALKKVPVYETFVEGAKDGFDTAIQIIPHLVGMMVAISVFRESGAMEILLSLVSPMADRLGFPEEVLPVAILRPITGAGSLAFTTELMQTYGPDSMIGRIASTMQGSTDTTLYVITVYFGAVGIRKVSYAMKVGLMSDVVGATAAIVICLWWFAV